jgi:hypothetical protein
MVHTKDESACGKNLLPGGERKKTALSPVRLYHNPQNRLGVILREAKNLIITRGCKIEILRLTPQNDIVTQSLWGER